MKNMIVSVRVIKVILLGAVSSFLIFMILFNQLNNKTVSAIENEVQFNLEKMEHSIDQMMEVDPLLALSSNPYDYIKNNQYYDNIMNLNIEALPYLEKELKNSQENGLNEYIFVIAMQEISKVDINGILEKEYAWENAKEFESKWTHVKNTVNDDVLNIIKSDSLSLKQKENKLSCYGLLAVPAMQKNLKNMRSMDVSVKQSIENMIQEFSISESDMNILIDYVK